MEKIVLFGTSEGSKLIYQSLAQDTRYEVVAFTVDAAYLKEPQFCGLPVVAFEEVVTIYPPSEYKLFVAIFANEMNKLRAEKYHQAKEKGYELLSYIHPQVLLSPGFQIGDNSFIFEGVIIRPELTVGNDVIVMPGAFLGHYTEIKDHCYIGCRAVIMGAVTVESYCFIGPNATVMEDLTVKTECLIGGGAVIQQSTKEKEVYRATPATVLPLTSDKMAKIIFRKRR